MNIITHALAGWCIGRQISNKPSDALFMLVASVIPDADALGVVADLYSGGEAVWFSEFHHKFAHNIFFCLIMLPFVWFLAKKSKKIVLWFLLVFHFHLFCDIIGAMGPDGHQWPVYYLYPYSMDGITWSGQWEINAWPNMVFTVFLIFVFLWQIAKTGFSPLGFVSHEADNVLVETLRKRFGLKDPVNK